MKNGQIKELFPNCPISITDELIHKDLNQWSKDLLAELKEQLSSKDVSNVQLCPYLNQAALISSLKGDFSEARSICELQIDWLREKIDKEGLDIDYLLGLLQPWINLGRLYHIEGKYGQAIKHFDMANRVANKQNLIIKDFEIANNQILEFLQDPEKGDFLDKFLKMNQIEGLVKLYIKSKNYLEGLSLIRSMKSQNTPSIRFLLEECEIILLIHQGNFQEAWKCSQQSKPRSPYKKLVLLYYVTLISYLTDQTEHSSKYGLKLSNYLSRATKEVNFIDLKKLLLQTAKLCSHIGLGHSAHTLFELGFDLGRKLEDQRYGLSFGLGLSQSNMTSEKEKHDTLGLLKTEAVNSYYRIRGLEVRSEELKPHNHLLQLKKYIQFNFAA
ncbi:MAG: hypothetical protein MRZ79_18135 [Bacteroidia bacterium]|nr:hypothetical protein [Bacteroidia bacterium]